MRYAFEDCELDTEAFELRRGGQPVHLEPQIFEILRYLVERADRVVPKTELLDNVWGDRFVSESALTTRIKAARRAVGDDGSTQRVIRTIHARGYRFVAPLREPPGADRELVAWPDSGRGEWHNADVASIPAPPTPTIGREREVHAIAALLRTAPIVTLLGPGGVGKTRLAIEVARLADGEARFVDLTKVRDAELVADLVVSELGLRVAAGGDSRAVLAEALRGRSMLLVLDNFEHVLEAATICADLVRPGAGVRVLTTSRARLRLTGERIVEVAPLSVEAGGAAVADAVALFDQTAVAIDPSFQLTAHLADVEAICRSVDGLPLAIELAAGHVRTLPPVLLRTRLRARLGSPVTSVRDAPSRQQTVPATIDWSLQLLAAAEQRLFTRLGVFEGAVPLEAVEEVCAEPDVDVVDGLSRLVDQSLVRRLAGTRGAPRFKLLELLRERARELLGGDERTVLADRHAQHVAAFLEDLDRRRWSDASDLWIDLITELLAEIRAAHAWARGRDPELAARITATLGTYWHREGHHVEAREWVADALAHVDELDPRLAARLHLAAGFVDWPYDELLARRHWDDCIEAFRTSGDDRNLAYALTLSAGTYIGDRSAYRLAMERCEEGTALARVVGERPLIAQALNVKGELARVHGDDAVARRAYEEGRDTAIAAGDEAHYTVFLANLSYLADHRGDYHDARQLGCDALRRCQRLGRRMMASWTLSELAGPELGLGRPVRGAIFIGAADEALRVLGVSRHPGDRSEHTRVVAGLRAALGEEVFAHRYAEGAALTLDEAMALALSEPDPPTG